MYWKNHYFIFIDNGILLLFFSFCFNNCKSIVWLVFIPFISLILFFINTNNVILFYILRSNFVLLYASQKIIKKRFSWNWFSFIDQLMYDVYFFKQNLYELEISIDMWIHPFKTQFYQKFTKKKFKLLLLNGAEQSHRHLVAILDSRRRLQMKDLVYYNFHNMYIIGLFQKLRAIWISGMRGRALLVISVAHLVIVPNKGSHLQLLFLMVVTIWRMRHLRSPPPGANNSFEFERKMDFCHQFFSIWRCSTSARMRWLIAEFMNNF